MIFNIKLLNGIKVISQMKALRKMFFSKMIEFMGPLNLLSVFLIYLEK